MDFYVKGYTVTCSKCGKHIVDREYKMRDYIWPHPIEAKMVKRIGICDECQEKMAMEYRKWKEKEHKKEERWKKIRLREQTISLIRDYNARG